jgi:tetratricopeptide (TPR) repeat protein
VTLRDQLQQSLGRDFAIERELGGGMSRVFLAEDLTLGRKIVVKVLPPAFAEGVSIERFNREILLAAGLQHPHIVPLLSAGSMDGHPWYTMPFVEGESLRARLERGSLSISESVGLLRDVAKALSYAHEKGIVHRDIKPDNVLLSGGSATVTDFGIAKAISASRTDGRTTTLTQIGTSVGTPMYMAPEQAAGDSATDHRADLYSFGCVAYELLAGKPPFAGKSSPQQLLTAHMAEAPQSILELRPDAPGTLAGLVMRCLEKDPNARPQRADEIVRVLEDVPGTLIGSVGTFRNALLIYAMSLAAVAVIAKAGIVLGLPTWAFPGALIVMALGLPVILWTGYVHNVTRQVLTSRFTPGGTAALAPGTMATIALKSSPHMSWRRTAQGGMISMAVFTLLVAGFMILRALGIGPEGSLLAAGTIAPQDRIMMTDFTVKGTDSALGGVVSDAVRAGLVQSPVLTLMTPAQVATVLRLMERPVTSYLDLALAREVGQRAGVKAIVDGDVTLVGSSYFLAVRLVTTDSGKELMSYRETAAGPEAIIDVADELTRKLRARAGESLRTVNGAPHLALVTTASLPALRKYSEAVRANEVEADYRKAVRLLRETLEIDTLFASAWRTLGIAMQNAGMPISARDSAYSRAFALRHRFTEQQLPLFMATYYFSGPGRDREKAIEIYDRMLSRGDTGGVLTNLAILVSNSREFARAETLSRALARRNPRGSLEGLLANLQRQGKWAESDSVLAVALVRFAGNTRYRELMLEQLQDRGEWDAYRRGVDSALRVPDPRNPSGAALRAATLAFAEARLRDADALLAEAFRIDSTVGVPYGERYAGSHQVMVPAMAKTETPLYQRVAAQLPHAAEMRAYELQLEKTPLSAISDADVPYLSMAGMFAQAGNPPRARAALDQYRREVSDTAVLRVRQSEMHAALGEIASAEGRWEDAAREMRLADSRPDGCEHCLSLRLFRVFATAGMTDSALAQYEAYRRTPTGSRPRKGPDPNIAAPTLETIGRMYEQRGDTARAVEAYRDFAQRWKRADPEFQPRVAAARKRLVALTSQR